MRKIIIFTVATVTLILSPLAFAECETDLVTIESSAEIGAGMDPLG